ncbi:MAG: DUF3267 domain-containing protein [Clostridia bacterium]|nr:DUF3267 domain-containing protein [Clostridia bacterium]
MKENNFERNLPSGYRVAKVIDEKKVDFLSVIIACFICVVLLFIGFIPLMINDDLLSNLNLFVLIYGILWAFIYSLLHELIHGIACKIKTGERFVYKIDLSGVYCTTPKILIYRKSALFVLLSPIVFFTVILIPTLVALYFIDSFSYAVAVIVFTVHIIGSLHDLYVSKLLTDKHKDEMTLVNFKDSKRTILVFDESLKDEEDENTMDFSKEFNGKKETEIDKEKKARNTKVSSVLCIVIFSISFLIHLYLTAFSGGFLYSHKSIEFYEMMSFYICIISAIAIIITSCTMKKYYNLKIVAIVLAIVSAIPLSFLSVIQTSLCIKSYTTDVNNYGVYDYPEYMADDYFPEKITDSMTPICYSYYLDGFFDVVYELYLEVQMTETEYEKYKSQYENELKDFFFASEYSEYVISDETSMYTTYSFEENYMDSPDIRKILFNDKDDTVIFISIYGLDPFYYENSYYFKRFNLDPMEYSNYLKENKNESN